MAARLESRIDTSNGTLARGNETARSDRIDTPLIVSSLCARERKRQLASSGLAIQTGCFTTRIQSSIPSVAEGIELLYADYPLVDETTFVDFHVQLVRTGGLRRWVKPQVSFLFD